MVPRGELKQKVQQKNLLIDAMELAEQSDYCDIRVVTLKQWLLEQAYDQAWRESSVPAEIERRAQELTTTKYSCGREFIRISTTGIEVCINVEEVNDKAIDRAIMLLSEIDNLTVEGTFNIGEEIRVYVTTHQQTRRNNSNPTAH